MPVMHCDQALARRLERAEGRANAEFVDARATAFPASGAQWMEIAGAYAMFDGADSPCTQTFGLGLFDAVTEADFTRVEQFFHTRGADAIHEISPLAELWFLAQLGPRGYQPLEWSSVLFRPIDPALRLEGPRDDSIHVRPIASSEHESWARISFRGWEDVAPGLEDFVMSLGQVNPLRTNTHCFLAEKQGEPIATGAIYLWDGIAVFAGASTIPKFRRQGAQLALFDHRLRFAAQQGCDLAMIVALPGSASQRNAERQGFRVAYTRTKWRLPMPGTHAASAAP